MNPQFLTLGAHIVVELSGCPRALLADLHFVQETLVEGVKRAKATLLAQNFYNFSPEGVSGILLLAESHCSIHTWPQEGYAAIDIYTCGDRAMPEVACAYISETLQAQKIFTTRISRGHHNCEHEGYQHRITSDSLFNSPQSQEANQKSLARI